MARKIIQSHLQKSHVKTRAVVTMVTTDDIVSVNS